MAAQIHILDWDLVILIASLQFFYEGLYISLGKGCFLAGSTHFPELGTVQG